MKQSSFLTQFSRGEAAPQQKESRSQEHPDRRRGGQKRFPSSYSVPANLVMLEIGLETWNKHRETLVFTTELISGDFGCNGSYCQLWPS